MSKTKEHLIDSLYAARELLIQQCLADEDCECCLLYDIDKKTCTVGCPCFWDYHRKEVDNANIPADEN